MTKTISSLLSIFAISILIIGCGSSNTTEKEPTEITTPTSRGTISNTLDSSQISEGVITDDVTISVATSDNKSTATVTLTDGTKFTDLNGNELDNVFPKLELDQAIGDLAANSNVTQKVQTKIELTDADGNRIIPTKAVTLKIKAPSNAKPGDKVKVSVPNSTSKSTTQEKLIIITIDENGFVTVTIFPELFGDLLVVIIIIEQPTVTGAEGGN